MHTKFIALIVASSACVAAATTTVTFSDLNVPAAGFYNGGPTTNAKGFTSNHAFFNNDFDATYGSWSGWSYSNVVNNTAAGYTNQYAAYTPAGGFGGGGTYAVGFPADYLGIFPTIDLPIGERPASVRVANTTYAALSIKSGDQFAKKFGGATGNDPDFLTVTFTGYADARGTGAATGATTFYLADYRFVDNSKDYVVSDWTNVDLAPLGAARSISVSLLTSDVDPVNGPATPLYVAIDNLSLVPEPATLMMIALPLALLRHRRS